MVVQETLQTRTATLAGKSKNKFRNVFKSYQSKLHKKAVKIANEILVEYPGHADTLAMKALTYNSMGKTEESLKLSKIAVKNNFSSFVAWHVLGIVYRSQSNYHESARCFHVAYTLEPEDLVIMTDLANIQLQLRDFNEYTKLRNKILQSKQSNQGNWLTFAMAAHLSGNYNKAIKILDSLENTGALDSDKVKDYEKSDIIMYKHQIIEETGDYQAAFDGLQSRQEEIVDKLTLYLKYADLHMKLGRFDEAENIFRSLLNRNPENHELHKGLLKSMHIIEGDFSIYNPEVNPEVAQTIVDMYDAFVEKYPRSRTCKLIRLNFSTGDNFKNLLEEYLIPSFTRAVPSTFKSINYLYKGAEKVTLIEEVLKNLEECLNNDNKFPNEELEEPPTSILFLNYFLAQHYNKLGNELAMTYIDKCIEHTPTVVEFFVTKAGIQKALGNFEEASDLMETARNMDLADRYLNAKSTKYLLRADRVEKAREVMSIYTKVVRSDAPLNNIFEMQVVWYEIAEAESYLRLGEIGKALEKLVNVEKHFLQYIDDQFDFHGYSIRKKTIYAYYHTLRFEDEIFGKGEYVKAAEHIVRIYLNIYDDPTIKRKKRTKNNQQNKPVRRGRGNQKNNQKEKENIPEKLLSTKKPLVHATRHLERLVQYAGEKLETHLLAYQVYIRRGKFLLSLRSLNRAAEFGINEEIQNMIQDFKSKVEGELEELDPTVAKIIQSEIANYD
eukprot:TRINITY_DN6311_c0_g1_i1.p1 TRINITY_DN6311_c0_g1~~TRINITY_DN6311_c0_g1_i1.p1  ORF type:complete len:725 (-),score=167.66 TRINITY_DN6311_c0_g1_i1:30-2204(-)